MITRSIYSIIFICSWLFISCENTLTSEIKTNECTPFISNPRHEWYSINDCDLGDGGAYASYFSILVDRYGDCINSTTPFTITAHYFSADGTEINMISFQEQRSVLRDKIQLDVCLRYGNAAQYVVMDINCMTANGKQSNTVSFTLPRPKDAN